MVLLAVVSFTAGASMQSSFISRLKSSSSEASLVSSEQSILTEACFDLSQISTQVLDVEINLVSMSLQ